MVTVERIKSDGSIKSYVVEGARPKPPKTRRPSRPRRRPYLSVVASEVESRLGVPSMPSTWEDTNARNFNLFDKDFHDEELWDCEYEELATEVEQPYLKREPNELLARIRGRRDRACHRSRRRHVKLAVYENHQFVGWQSKYAMTHKRGQPSGRIPGWKDIARETIRHMQPVEVEVYEPLHWIDELGLPDMGMVPHHALEAEESMIELVAA